MTASGDAGKKIYFFNASTGAEALAVLRGEQDDHSKRIPYVTVRGDRAMWPGQWQRGAFANTPNNELLKLRLEYWGQLVPFGSGKDDFRIGAMGQVWALLALRCTMVGHDETRTQYKQPQKLAEAIFKRLTEAKKNLTAPLTRILILDRPLSFSNSTDHLSILGHGSEIVRATARFCADSIAKRSGDDPIELAKRMNDIVTTCDASTVDDAHQRLCRALDFGPSGKSWIEDSVQKYIDRRRDNEPDEATAADEAADLMRRLAGKSEKARPNCGRVVGICGEAHSGKKSVVGELLFEECSARSEDILFPLKTKGDDPNLLPVLCLDISRLDYIELLDKVQTFLHKIADAASPSADDSKPHKDISSMLQEIERLHRGSPALFIFMDVQGLGLNDPNRLVGMRGFRRMLRRLYNSESDSRFILTIPSSEASAIFEEPTLQGLKIVRQDISPPKIKRLSWYLNDGEALIAKLPSFSTAAANAEVNGEDMLALSLLEPEEAYDHDTFMAKIEKFASKASQDRDAGRIFVFDELVSYFTEQDLLQAVLLVATSIDGVSEETLRQCLLYWLQEAPEDFPKIPDGPPITIPHGKDADHKSARQQAIDEEIAKQKKMLADMCNRFAVMSEKGKGLFLRFGTPVHFDMEEFAFDEVGGRPGDEGPKLWSFSSTAAAEIIRAVYRTDDATKQQMVSRAHLTIARAARRRGQLKKLRARDEDPYFRTQNIGRDVQAYISLLSGLDMAALPTGASEVDDQADIEQKDDDAGTYQIRSPAFFPDLVFSISDMEPPEPILRYAIFSMLRGDIDIDARLSMQSDQDSLRLLLYTLPFVTERPLILAPASGQEDAWLSQHVLPRTEAPKGLVHALGEKAVIELLETVAVSAYYCTKPEMIAWAKRLAKPIFERNPSFRDPFTRILLCEIDYSILLGSWQFVETPELEIEDPDNPFARILAEINARVDEMLPGACINIGESEKRRLLPGSESDHESRSYMQFQARRAEVLWHMRPEPDDANAVFAELEKLEKERLNEDPLKAPVVFIGRTGRRRLRSLLHDLPVLKFVPEELEFDGDVMRDLDLLITNNLARLVKYSGGERLGVMLDYARRHILNERFVGVKLLMDDLRQRADSGILSPEYRVEISMLDFATTLVLLDRQPELLTINTRFWRDQVEAVELLLEMTATRRFVPALLKSQLLQYRLTVVAKAHDEDLSSKWTIQPLSLQQLQSSFEKAGFLFGLSVISSVT